MVGPVDVAALVSATFAADQGRTVASLIRSFGDITLAEESVQDAYARALTAWPTAPPDVPAAWILTTARNAAIDRLRRQGRLESKTAEMAGELDRRASHHDDPFDVEVIADDRLRLLFLCAHPALDADAQVALTMRLVAGIPTRRIAATFLVKEATMAARLTRAKRRIAEAGAGLVMPEAHELGDRVRAVTAVLYLAFTQGHLPSDGEDLVDVELVDEAVRLARLLCRLIPDDPEVMALLALMRLTDARRTARSRGGRLVTLAEQDRSAWDAAAIAEGLALVERALRRGRPGPYQLQAAIQAVHGEAATFADTDWTQIAGLYRVLMVADPSPVVALNHAVAVHLMGAPDGGPEAGLALIEPLRDQLDGYHLLHVSRAEMLAALDRRDEAAVAVRRAAQLTDNVVEQRFLADRLAQLR